jgi:hypothetical protein
MYLGLRTSSGALGSAGHGMDRSCPQASRDDRQVRGPASGTEERVGGDSRVLRPSGFFRCDGISARTGKVRGDAARGGTARGGTTTSTRPSVTRVVLSTGRDRRMEDGAIAHSPEGYRGRIPTGHGNAGVSRDLMTRGRGYREGSLTWANPSGVRGCRRSAARPRSPGAAR